MKRCIFFAFVVGLLQSCSTFRPQAENEIRIEVSEINGTFLLSRLYNHYEIMPLGSSEDVLIGQIDNLVPFDNRYYAGDSQTGKILVFDKKGEYIFSVGRQGRGPGEYTRFLDFTIGPDSLLYVLSDSPTKIGRYRPDGVFLDEFDVPLAMNLAVDETFIYLYADGRYKPGERAQAYQLYVLDKKGKEVARSLSLDEVKSYPYSMKYNHSRPFSATENGMLFSMLLDETIYRLKQGKVTSAYTLNYGAHTIPDHLFNEDRNPDDFFTSLAKERYAKDLHYVYEVDDDLFFNVVIDNRYHRLMVKGKKLYAVEDDLFGGDIYPALFVMNKKEYIGVLTVDALLVQFEHGGEKGLELKEKFTSTGVAIDENSNPLLIRYWN